MSCHEPLILAFVQPFLPAYPWELRFTDPLLELGRAVQGVWKDSAGDVGRLLWQLLLLPATMASMPERLVRKVLHTS